MKDLDLTKVYKIMMYEKGDREWDEVAYLKQVLKRALNEINHDIVFSLKSYIASDMRDEDYHSWLLRKLQELANTIQSALI